jgi:hypothetical protein
MFARVLGSRTVAPLTGAFVVVVSCASSLIGGCGGSGAAPSTAGDAGSDVTVYSTVMTTGGGDATPAANPFLASASSSSGGSGSDSGMDSGSSSGGSDSGSTDGAGDGGSDGSVEGSVPYTAPSCNGTDPCDLRSNTCCLGYGASGLVGTCTGGSNATCPTNEATVHCVQAVECGGGLVCCGDIITLLGQVQSTCQAIPQGSYCPFADDASVSQIGVQLCKTDAECTTGEPCVHQTCIYGAVLDMCGLQSGSPLNCTQTQ